MTQRGRSSERGYGRIERDLDAEVFAELVSESFATTPDSAISWAHANRDRIRLWRQGGRIVGGLIFIEMGQFFGGRSVPMIGIAGVCTSPAVRGRGSATDLMRSAIGELARGPAPVSSLYPATLPLYRRAGYEIAGARYTIAVPAAGLTLDPTRAGKGDPLTVRRMTDADAGAVERLYRTAAADRAGWLDRGDYIWSRIRRQIGDRELRGHIIAGDKVEGYAFVELDSSPSRGYDVIIRDAIATTPRAIRRLVSLIGAFRTLGREVIWHGSPDDPVVALLAEVGCQIKIDHQWMIRLVDVRGALTARGYAPGLRAKLELDVTDDLVRSNRGKITLDVAGGEARVREGGRGALRLDIRALASLYTGYLGARRLATLGLASGPPRTLAIADTVFAGAPPSCLDMF